MDQKSYDYGFRLGWYSGVKEARRAYGCMRAEIVDALASDVPLRTHWLVLEALNDFQKKSDWEFDVE